MEEKTVGLLLGRTSSKMVHNSYDTGTGKKSMPQLVFDPKKNRDMAKVVPCVVLHIIGFMFCTLYSSSRRMQLWERQCGWCFDRVDRHGVSVAKSPREITIPKNGAPKRRPGENPCRVVVGVKLSIQHCS